jgi:diadenosine tetraphosphate (Ap4A) HIT family hydrolase
MTERAMQEDSVQDDTIFGKIIRREIPADIVYENDDVIAFRDIAPQAPVHVLFVPKTPIATLDDLRPGQEDIVGGLVLAAADYARREGFAQDGYRVVMNCNADGGQTVFQIHLHLLAGAPLGRFGTPAR